MDKTMRRIASHNSGLTLIESLMAIGLLAVSITAVTMPFTAAAQAEIADAQRTIAAALAREMMEEILAVDFYDPDGPSLPGPEGDETDRLCFDNFDDYDGYTEADGAVFGLDGTVMEDPASKGLSRSVTVDYVYVYGQSGPASPTFARISVVVRHEGHDVANVVRLVYAKDSLVEEPIVE